MNKLMKESGQVLVNIIKNISVTSANTACIFAVYESKAPKDLKKLRKF